MKRFIGVWIVDLGSQYSQLIARRIREAMIYCEIIPWQRCLERLKSESPEGIVFTCGPADTNEHETPALPGEMFELDEAIIKQDIPILKIYGMQTMIQLYPEVIHAPYDFETLESLAIRA